MNRVNEIKLSMIFETNTVAIRIYFIHIYFLLMYLFKWSKS